MTDFSRVKTLTAQSHCVAVDEKHHVVITRRYGGIVVDIFQLPYPEGSQADVSDASCYSYDRRT